jgi:hypothetical protein
VRLASGYFSAEFSFLFIFIELTKLRLRSSSESFLVVLLFESSWESFSAWSAGFQYRLFGLSRPPFVACFSDGPGGARNARASRFLTEHDARAQHSKAKDYYWTEFLSFDV